MKPTKIWISAFGALSLLFSLSWFVSSCSAELPNGQSRKIVCFYSLKMIGRPGSQALTPRDIDPMLCTHLIYAYAGLDDDDKIIPILDKEKGGYARFNALKSYNKNLHTLLAVGKGLSRQFSAIAADHDRRNKFSKHAVMYLRVNRFSGINLSWQCPGSRLGSSGDKTNYVLLLQALREEFEKESNITGKPSLLISLDIPHSVKVVNDGFDILSLEKYLDFINLFSFNYKFPAETEMGHLSPLYTITNLTDYGYASQNNVDATVKYFLTLGVSRVKLMLGIATYGHTLLLYEPKEADGLGVEEGVVKSEGVLPYFEICTMLKSKGWKIENTSSNSLGPYARYDNFLVEYEDQKSVRQKAQYADKEDLGGLMFWTIDYDDFKGDCHGKKFPLIEAGKESFISKHRGSQHFKLLNSAKNQPLLSLKIGQDVKINMNRNGQYREEVGTSRSRLSSVDNNYRTLSSSSDIQFSPEDLQVLQQLVTFVKQIGGIPTLERLLGTLPRTLDRGTPLYTSHQYEDVYGREVTSMTVTSPTLSLKKTANPLVLSNFTVNINEIRIDTSALPRR